MGPRLYGGGLYGEGLYGVTLPITATYPLIKGGGGEGFRPIILETLIMRYGLKGKARTRPDFFRLVLGPCAQFYPFEASEQKWGQTPKS